MPVGYKVMFKELPGLYRPIFISHYTTYTRQWHHVIDPEVGPVSVFADIKRARAFQRYVERVFNIKPVIWRVEWSPWTGRLPRVNEKAVAQWYYGLVLFASELPRGTRLACAVKLLRPVH